jgi:serine/threonine-protein kinase
LGSYEILEVIGTGGMGEVYKARDPRLNRTVAIKVLLDRVSTSSEARARFEREAQTIAGLNHPHICVVYDVGRHENTDFLVMEHLDGETLARRLEKGPLPLEQALKYAIEIADALDKAHQERVTHRDLKPGNIMLTATGAKLLDFGLAKLRSPQNISTLSEAATKAEITAEGTIIGSLQYMAPEQLEGSEADPRTDIFAFGVVLYEMVTGRKAFEGKSMVSLMSAILKDTPTPVTSWQTVAPERLDQAIASCLAKNPEDRWQSARDLGRELKRIAEIVRGSKDTLGQAKVESPSSHSNRRVIQVGVAAALVAVGGLLAASGFWIFARKTHQASPGIVRLSVALQPGEELQSFAGPPVALSPDGKLLAFASVRRGRPALLYLRPINASEAEAVSGSDAAFNPSRLTESRSAFLLRVS